MWAILQWVGILSGERTPECLFFCVFLLTHTPPSLLGGFWGVLVVVL